MERFFCSKLKLPYCSQNFENKVFKYEKEEKFFKCYASVKEDNKIIYIQCYPLFKDEDLICKKIEKRLYGYYLK